MSVDLVRALILSEASIQPCDLFVFFILQCEEFEL